MNKQPAKGLSTLHFARLFNDFNIGNGDSGFDTKTLLINQIVRKEVYIHSFSYSVSWLNPLFATQPVIGVVISRYSINENPFTSTSDTEQAGILHIDAHQEFPINETVFIREPYLHLTSEDVLNLGLSVDNVTGGTFTKTVRVNFLLNYLT